MFFRNCYWLPFASKPHIFVVLAIQAALDVASYWKDPDAVRAKFQTDALRGLKIRDMKYGLWIYAARVLNDSIVHEVIIGRVQLQCR